MISSERELLNARIGELLHAILVQIRNYTYPPVPDDPDRREELNDLADLAHNLPRYIVGHDEFAVRSAESLRAEVIEHVKKYYPGTNPLHHRFVYLLDMDARTFLTQFRDHNWNSPELEPVSSLS